MSDPPRYHHGNLPQALLDALDAVIRERGPSSISLRQVASRAGVSVAAPSHHFRDKRGLLTAFAAQGLELFDEMLERALAGSGSTDSARRLRTLCSAYVEFALERPAHFAVVGRPDLYDTEDPAVRRPGNGSFEKLRKAVADHQHSGWRASEDPLALAVSIWSAMHGLATLWLAGLVDESLREGGIAPLTETLLATVGLDRPFVSSG